MVKPSSLVESNERPTPQRVFDVVVEGNNVDLEIKNDKKKLVKIPGLKWCPRLKLQRRPQPSKRKLPQICPVTNQGANRWSYLQNFYLDVTDNSGGFSF